MKKVSELVIIMAMLNSSASADSPYQEGDGWHGIIGGGAIIQTEPYKEVSGKIFPLPYVIIRRGHFFLEGLRMGLRMVESENGNIDLILKPRLEGFDADDSDYLKGMDDRDYSLDGGIATRLQHGMVELNFMAVTDLLDRSDGQEIHLSVGNTYIIANQMAMLTPSFGLKWQSGDLVNYYYGVQPHESREDRPVYLGKSTLNYIAALKTSYLLTKRSTLFGGVEYEHLGKDITDSPLSANDKPIIKLFLGYGWQF
jgi:outer membrane protein